MVEDFSAHQVDERQSENSEEKDQEGVKNCRNPIERGRFHEMVVQEAAKVRKAYVRALTMNNFTKIILKRKWFFLFAFVLAFGVTLLGLRLRGKLYETAAVVRILEHADSAGVSLLISQTKQIISPLVMEKAVLKLEWAQAGDSAERMQKKILELQRAVSVVSQGGNGIVEIRARHVVSPESVKMANAVAGAYEEMDRAEAGAETRQFQDYLQRQFQNTQKKISELEEKIMRIEKNAPPAEVADGLRRDLDRAAAGRETLLKVFTAKHPEVIKLDEEINHLRQELAALPQPEGDVNALKAELEQARQAAGAFSSQLQDVQFKQAEETGHVRILRRAAAGSKPVRAPLGTRDVLVGIFAGVLAGFLAVFAAESRRSKLSF